MARGIFWVGQQTQCHPFARGPADLHTAVVRRSVMAQSLYAAGAALAFINTYYSSGAIVPVQMNDAIAPGLCWGLFATRMRREERA